MFIGSCAGRFYALNKESGKEVWSYDTRLDGGPRSFHGDPLLYKNSVLVVSDRGCGQGAVYSFEPTTGKVRWKLQASASTGFTQVGSSVFFGTREGEWMALDAESGKIRWRIKPDPLDPQCEIGSAPVSDGVNVGIVDHSGTIWWLNAQSGENIWQQNPVPRVTSSLFLYKDVLYFGAGNKLLGMDLASGKQLSQLETPAELKGGFSWSHIGESENEFVFGVRKGNGRNTGVLLAFSDEFERVLWAREADQEWTSEQPHLWKQWVIAGNCKGDLMAYNTSDGKAAWSYHVKGCVRSFGHDESTLYVGVQEGTVYALRVGQH